MNFWALLLPFLWKRVQSTVYSPCTYPNPSRLSAFNFTLLCQTGYHRHAYVCDPPGLLSRTHTDLFHQALSSNFSSCLCAAKDSKCRDKKHKFRLAVAVVPVATLDAAIAPGAVFGCPVDRFTPFAEPEDRRISFAEILADQWTQCNADLLIVAILKWSGQIEEEPTIVPLYRRRLKIANEYPDLVRVIHYSNPRATPSLLLAYARRVERIFNGSETVDDQIFTLDPFATRGKYHSIPFWAVAVGAALLFMAGCGICVANCVTSYTSVAKSMPNKGGMSIRMAHNRWKPGGGGGDDHKPSFGKSTMMFRQFSHRKHMASAQPSNQI